MIALADDLSLGYVLDGECWIWTRAKNSAGYAIVRLPGGRDRGKLVLVHRLTSERAFGPIPEGMTLDHLCRRRACVNPAHTERVSQAENIRRGLRTKLSLPDVEEIRSRASTETRAAIARDFSVSGMTVSRIARGVSWA